MLTARSDTDETVREVSEHAYRATHTHPHTPARSPLGKYPRATPGLLPTGIEPDGRAGHRQRSPPSYQLVREAFTFAVCILPELPVTLLS
jgi:hypothetical protein